MFVCVSKERKKARDLKMGVTFIYFFAHNNTHTHTRRERERENTHKKDCV